MRDKGPWVYEGDGSTQIPLHQLLKQPEHGTIIVFPAPTFTVSPVGRAQPPHVTITSFPLPDPPSHAYYPRINFHNRPLVRKGHKVGRMNGIERQIWGATQWFNYCNRALIVPAYYPTWDPLGRQPTDTVAPWDM